MNHVGRHMMFTTNFHGPQFISISNQSETCTFIWGLAKLSPWTWNLLNSLTSPSAGERSYYRHRRRVCPHCNIQFARLDIHIREVHLKIKRYKCQFCEKRFGRSANRLSHMRNVHNELFDPVRAELYFQREQLERGIRKFKEGGEGWTLRWTRDSSVEY